MILRQPRGGRTRINLGGEAAHTVRCQCVLIVPDRGWALGGGSQASLRSGARPVCRRVSIACFDAPVGVVAF